MRADLGERHSERATTLVVVAPLLAFVLIALLDQAGVCREGAARGQTGEALYTGCVVLTLGASLGAIPSVVVGATAIARGRLHGRAKAIVIAALVLYAAFLGWALLSS